MLLLVLIGSTAAILEGINRSFMILVPARGGEISEGITGTPRFVNPVLALSDADEDLVSLIYSGLMRKMPDGEIVPDLAKSYEMSPDGLTYTFTLEDKIFFQDGTPITADDVVFTVNEMKDPVIKSPHKGNWDGVNVTKVDDKTVEFTLRQPYASFLDNMTVGIMPAKLWQNSPVELNDHNTNPIGSGPYQVYKVTRESSGIIDSYELTSFKKFNLGEPYIKKMTLKFYPNQDATVSALENGDVEQISSITPAVAEELKGRGYRVESAVLPRIFGLFFNQNENQIFVDKNVVSAINLAIDKDRIVREVLGGYGVVIDGPIPPALLPDGEGSNATTVVYQDNLAQAESLLAKDGWKKGDDGFLQKTSTDKKKKTTAELAFTISTGNAPELAQAAELIKDELQAIGMNVDVKTYEIGNLNQAVIRPRKYDTLLFGEVVNHESDLFAFWHSSQRKDPGLNVAIYTNANVDKLLEDAFVTADSAVRDQKYAQFESIIQKDMPAVFLYSPSFIYVVSKNLKDLNLGNITSPSDRFLDAYTWYTNTDSVWKIFSRFYK